MCSSDLKASRYALEGLEGALSPVQQAWLPAFRSAQDCLGRVQDLAVLRATLEDRRLAVISARCHGLRQRLRQEQRQQLARWGELALWWSQSATRLALIGDLTCAAAASSAPSAPTPAPLTP